ncbi:MAG: hypothetical protein A2172_01555 [Candidatus Woykebacteria bacterium RBG_13_40_15]|uniref:AB hydrolase-1 domain-containing protein n=1 Tax=Candidatus Woykebacteria bacterium RBG_13_40_15 TaxID=1802593 RepID=A0A1G1WA61_9BACT|nr:MAG: hypothetical protein A2172_01555 [Candidatus Woykebacteria bacterium RBG_13_40_15]
MRFIQTKSFKLATYAKGDENATKLALVLPGRLDTKDYSHIRSHVDFLASLGYFALLFDPPGTWDSPGGINLFTTTNYIKAINELIEYFGNKPTLLLGHSRGGTTSILAGASNSHVVGFAPIMATYGEPTPPDPESIKSGVKMSYRDLPPGNSKTKEQKEFALPINYFKDGEQYNVIDVLEKCTKPKLVLYGTRDEFTTPERVKEVFEDIPEPKMIRELDTDHDYRYHPAVIEEVNSIIGDFVKQYKL